MEHIHSIVNPAAAGGSCLEQYRAAKAVLEENGVSLTEWISEAPGQISVLTHRALEEGAKTILLAGGDGTLREAISALAYRDVKLFLLPFGTGNDFARFAGIALEPRAAAEQFLRGTVQVVDAGLANGRHFMNVAGLGLDVTVLQETERYRKRFPNKRAYFMGLASALVHLRNRPAQLWCDGKEVEQNFIVISVGNGSFIGGGIHALPDADMADGKLDVCIMGDVHAWRIPTVLSRFIKGRHRGLTETDYGTAMELTVHTKTPLPVQLDGEIIEQTPVTFRVLPGAIRLIL